MKSAADHQRPSFSAYYERPKYQHLFRWIDHRKVHIIQRELADFEPGATIIDLGCGAGSIVARTTRELDFAIATDHDPHLLSAARRCGSNAVQLDLDADLPFSSDSIHVVLCTDVIEHIIEPGRILEEMHRILRPGGLLIVFTPPYDSIRWNLAERLHHFVTKRRADHISPFTRESLAWWVGRSFDVCRLGRVNWNLSMYAIARKKAD
jgi:2-polyprenyl-3-methyl-5-hydroxy-6-metoxy-1,4-benzoquinol methylase